MSKRSIIWWFGALLLVGIVVILAAVLVPKPRQQVQAQLVGLPVPVGNFARAEGVRPFDFPNDFGAHPDFQTEWWYYTGNLTADSGEQFGYQLTFFRRALLSPEDDARLVGRSSAWVTDQVYLAHFTLTDVSNRQFHAFERYERGAAGLAGADGLPRFHVWLRDWSVEQTGTGEYQLSATQGGMSVQLKMKDTKGPVLQGDRGYSQKGPEPGNASYYFSQTHLVTNGEISVNGETFTVSGLSWMDHEFSTSALSSGQVGWDWFSFHLDDGSELMLYAIRREDGSVDPFSSGTIISADGSTRMLNQDDFHIDVLDSWSSPHTGGIYPSRWSVSVPSENLTLHIEPLVADQELNLSFIYWEGAVSVAGDRNGAPLSGQGYVELTGYAQSLSGRF